LNNRNTKLIFPVRRKTGGQKLEESLREGEFLPACCPPKEKWGGKVFSQFLRQQEGRQNRKIFVSFTSHFLFPVCIFN